MTKIKSANTPLMDQILISKEFSKQLKQKAKQKNITVRRLILDALIKEINN